MDIINKASVRPGDASTELIQEARKTCTVACDIETTGLDWKHDSIQTCQIFVPDFAIEIVRIESDMPLSLLELLEDYRIKKVFHHAMFDLRFFYENWGTVASNVACTKIAAKILEPKAKSHSLKPILKKRLGIDISKGLAKSDWTVETLEPEQIRYAATDVAFLPQLLNVLEDALRKADRFTLAQACFQHIPTRVVLEVNGYGDVFTY
jgi:ribonuclease D